MLQGFPLKALCTTPLRGQLEYLHISRGYSHGARREAESAEIEAARAWYRNFNESTIPEKVAKTTYVAAGGPGGQKTNKYAPISSYLMYVDSLMCPKDGFQGKHRLGLRCSHNSYSEGAS